ncbi:MAG: hypothetical protein AAGF15_05755 [Pseudomonadota bacterium]
MRSGPLLKTSPANEFKALGAFGQPVYQSYTKLEAVLTSQAGEELARYFARPQPNSTGDTIDWYAPLDGDVRHWSSISNGERSALSHKISTIQDQLRTLIGRYDTIESDEQRSRSSFARILGQAARSPGLHTLYVVGDQPVLTLWGFEGDGGAFDTLDFDPSGPIPDMPEPTVDQATLVPPIIPIAPDTDPNETDDEDKKAAAAVVAAGTPWWKWLLYGLLALLLIALLLGLLRFCAEEELPSLLPQTPEIEGEEEQDPDFNEEPEFENKTELFPRDEQEPRTYIAPNGQRRIVPRGYVIGPDGTPIPAPGSGLPPLEFNEDGVPIGPDGEPLPFAPNGEPLPLTPDGEIVPLDPNGDPVPLGPDGEPLEEGVIPEDYATPLPPQPDGALGEEGDPFGEGFGDDPMGEGTDPSLEPGDPGEIPEDQGLPPLDDQGLPPLDDQGLPPLGDQGLPPQPEGSPPGSEPLEPDQGGLDNAPGEEAPLELPPLSEGDLPPGSAGPDGGPGGDQGGPEGDPNDPNNPDAGNGSDPAPGAGVGFLKGQWRSDSGLVDQATGKPLKQQYSFDDKGSGQVTLERADGVKCTGKASAQRRSDGGVDIIEQGSIQCPDGRSFAPSKTECRPNASGRAVCRGVNPDGSSFRVRITR